MQLYTKTIGQGENVVLLHGWGFHSGIFSEFAEMLAEFYTVTVMDLPGFGKSPTLPNDYTLDNVVKAVLSGAPKGAHYLGWSLGGLIACRLAHQNSDRVKSLLMLASSPCFIAKQAWPGITRERLAQFENLLNEQYSRNIAEFALLQLPEALRSKSKFIELKKIIAETVPDFAVLKSGLKLLAETDLRKELNEITCKKMCLLGELDSLVPRELAEAMFKKIDIEVKIIAKAAHAPFISHRDETVSTILEFLHVK